MTSTSPPASTLEIVVVEAVSVTPSDLVIDFANELEKRLHQHMLCFETGVRVPPSVIHAMIQIGIWDSFCKILEHEMEQKDSPITQPTTELGRKRPHSVEEEDDDDDNNDYDDVSDDISEKENNECGVTEQTVKKQKITYLDISTQTYSDPPIFFNPNAAWETELEPGHTYVTKSCYHLE